MSSFPEWTDIRYFLELARAGTLAEAAQRLEVESSTVSRRIDRLEQHLRTCLFDRTRRGYALTDAGHALLRHAEAMESSLLSAIAEAGPPSGRLAGKVRVGCPEVFGAYVLTPRLHPLCELHPDLQFEVVAEQRFPDIVNREVDILINSNPPKSGRYVVARLFELNYELFGSSQYLASRKPIRSLEDLSGHDVVDYIQDRLVTGDVRARYIEQIVHDPRRAFLATSFFSQIEAVAAGLGLGLMAPYAVKRHDSLVRIFPGQALVRLPCWISVPEDLFRVRRIRVVWDFIRAIVEREPGLFVFLD